MNVSSIPLFVRKWAFEGSSAKSLSQEDILFSVHNLICDSTRYGREGSESDHRVIDWANGKLGLDSVGLGWAKQ